MLLDLIGYPIVFAAGWLVGRKGSSAIEYLKAKLSALRRRPE